MSKVKMSTRDIITMLMLFIMTTFLFAEQSIMSAILPELAKDFNTTERVLGAIGSAFIVIGAIMSLTFGYLADKQSRKMLFVVAILVGEIPCVLTGLKFASPDIYWFTAWRVLSGIGLGAVYPLSHSVLADYFKEEHRAFASAWMGVAWGIGGMMGVSIAGYTTNMNLFDLGWRLSFLAIGLPNIPIVLAFWAYAKEPERGRSENALEELIQQGVIYKQKIHLSDFKVILSSKTNLLTLIQGIPGSVPWGIFSYWLITYFRNVRHVSQEMATTIFLVLGIGSTLGGVAWAYLGDKLWHKDPRYMPILCGSVIIGGILPTAILLNIPMSNTIYMVFGFMTGFIVSVASANYKAILMNVNRPENRGSVFAVSNLTDNLGMGLGPVVGGLLLAQGYQFMMNFAIAWWLPCGLIFLMVAKYITKDRDKLQEYLNEQAKIMEREKA